jgi:outer membrane protein OmpA-like peptidoglycan-associated protein
VLVVGLICFLLFRALFSDGQESKPQSSATSTVGPSTPATPSTPNFTSQEQREIYQTLKGGGKVILEDIPSGSAVEGNRMLTFLTNLASVLRETNMRVSILVYTDSTGTADKNRSTAEQRGTNIKNWLETQGRVSAGTVTTVGAGNASPVVPPNIPNQAQRNRRLEVMTTGQ